MSEPPKSEGTELNPGNMTTSQVQRLDGEISASGLRSALDKILSSGIPVGILHVSSPNKSGAIFIRAGAVKAAIAPASNLQGLPALKQVLAAAEGKYRFSTDLPREPIRETLNIDIASLLNWRHDNFLDDPPLAAALSVLAASNPYGSWSASGQGETPTVVGTPPSQPEAPHPTSTDQFGLQEALSAYEQQKKREPELSGEDNQPDSARRHSLEELKEVHTQSFADEITQRFNVSDLRASPTPNTAAPVPGQVRTTGEVPAGDGMLSTGEQRRPDSRESRNTGERSRSAMPYQRVGTHEHARPSGAHNIPGAPDGQIRARPARTNELTLPTGETLKASKVRQMHHSLISGGIAAVLLVTAVIATNKMLSENNAVQGYNRGMQFLKDGYKDLAKKNFDKVLEKEPQNVKALLGRGTANLQLNDFPAARRDFDAALKVNPKNLDALNGKSETFLKMRDYWHAISACEESLKIKGDDPQALSNAALAYLELGKYKLAIDAIDKVIAEKPSKGLASAYATRGNAQFARKKYDQARNDYSRALEVDPNNRANFGKRARAEYQLKEYNAASADATQAIFGDPTNPALHMLRGESFEQLGQFDKAVLDFDKAVGLKPGIDAYAARARAHLAMKNYNRAAADLSEIVKHPQSAPHYKQQLEMVQQKIKAMPVAKLDIDALIGQPVKPVVLKYDEMVRHGFALLQGGRAAEAVKVLAMAVTANPQDVGARRYLARAYAKAGFPNQAIEQFKQVESMDRLQNADRTAYAHALVGLRQMEPATALLNSVVSQDPDFHEARVLLIECLLKRNDKANAIELCRAGLSRARTAEDQAIFQQLYKVSVDWQPH
jgi:tetratricopeptide (TPR) repeat protein